MAGDLFLRAAVEWLRIADRARATTDDEDDRPLRVVTVGLWRELVWCHLLFRAGKHTAVVNRLRKVWAACIPADRSGPNPAASDRVEVLASAAELLRRLRLAVSTRYPAALEPTHRSA